MGGWFGPFNTSGGGSSSGVSINKGLGDTTIADPVIGIYDTATAVPMSTLTTVVSHTCTGTTHLMYVEFGGTNIAQYYLYLDAVEVNQYITDHREGLNGHWDIRTVVGGQSIPAGTVISVKVLHGRTMPGDFYGKINIVQVDQ